MVMVALCEKTSRTPYVKYELKVRIEVTIMCGMKQKYENTKL